MLYLLEDLLLKNVSLIERAEWERSLLWSKKFAQHTVCREI